MDMTKYRPVRQTLLSLAAMATTVLVGCASTAGTVPEEAARNLNRDTTQLLVVDCLLPGQLRRLGQIMTFLTPRRPAKVSASECEIRGGEYVAYDRANFATALKIWLPLAKEGDAEAQTYVGEIYEKGLGLEPDLEVAASWYQQAADQNFSRAQINLGYLYESGLGVMRDLTVAMNYYRAASGFTDGNLEYVTSVEVANRQAQKKQVVDLTEQVAELESANDELRQKQAQLNGQQQELAQLREEIETQRALVVQASAVQPAETQSADDDTQLSAALIEIDSLNSQLAESQTSQGRLVRELEDQQLETSQLRQRFAKATTELTTARQDLEQQQQRIGLLNGKLTTVTADTSRANDQATIEARKDLEAELANEKRVATELESEVARLQQSQSAQSREIEQTLRSAEGREVELKRELDTASSDITRLQASLTSQEQNYQQQLATLSGQLDTLQASQSQLNDQLAATDRGRAELEQQNAALTQDLATKQSQLTELENRLVAAQQTDNSTDAQTQQLVDEIAAAKQDLTASQLEQGKLARQLDALQQETQAQSQQDAANIARLEDANLAISANAEQQQRVVDDLRAQLAQSQAQLAEENAGSTQAASLQQRSEELEAELVAAKAEQQRLTDRLMEGEIKDRTERKTATLKLAQLERDLFSKQQVISSQQTEISALQTRVTRTRASLDQPEIEQIIKVVNSGPSIEIIEPPVTISRGKPALASSSGVVELNVIGRINPPESLLAFQINGKDSTLNSKGVFTHKISADDTSSLRLVAVDDAGERTELEFGIVGNTLSETAESAVEPVLDTQAVDFGEYHALIIGNNEYDHMQNLRTAENDAIAIETMLRSKFGFKTELLLNASRYDLLSALNRKRDELTEKDNLLIYYAGHGELSNAKGYWMPTDAEPDNTSNWVSNSSITDLVESMSAKHVMIIADSCYSGSLSRSSLTRLNKGMSPEKKLDWYRSIASSKVRTVLTSGGVKPVLDSTGDSQHSLFSEALLDELAEAEGVVETYELFLRVQDKVKTEAEKLALEQNPQYSPIRYAGHESGEFLFVAGDADGRTAQLDSQTDQTRVASALSR